MYTEVETHCLQCRSRMDAMHEMKASGQKLQEAAAAHQGQQVDVDNIDQQIATLMGEIQKMEAMRNHHRYPDAPARCILTA